MSTRGMRRGAREANEESRHGVPCPDHTRCVCTSCRENGRCTRNDPHPPCSTITQLRTELEASRLECERLRVDAGLFKGLLSEAYEMADNWPGIAYTYDLCARIDAAMKKERT